MKEEVPSTLVEARSDPLQSAKDNEADRRRYASKGRFLEYVWEISLSPPCRAQKCERVVYRHGAILTHFCGCALPFMLGVLDIIAVEVQNRDQVEERENVEARETEEEDTNKETTNAQTCDDMWMNMFHADTSCDTLSRNVMCAQG